jgi:hypothetical protein
METPLAVSAPHDLRHNNKKSPSDLPASPPP